MYGRGIGHTVGEQSPFAGMYPPLRDRRAKADAAEYWLYQPPVPG